MQSTCALPILFRVVSASLLLSVSTLHAAPPPKAIELRNLGFAELENERPEQAEPLYRQLIALVPDDPLGHANLAIAELRQQKYAEALAAIDKALAKAPGQADLLAIKGEILQWTGDLDGALKILDQAAQKAPQDLEILYAAYQLASTLKTLAADDVAVRVVRQLAKLRPENVVVMLQLGQRAIAIGDRSLATGAYDRLAELLWQEQPIARKALDMVVEALNKDDLAAARVPAIRLENVLKISPMFRESLRELKTGIQGIPLQRFRDEPPVSEHGKPLAITFAGARLDERPGAGRALAVGDFDGDGKADLARIRAEKGGVLEVRRGSAGWKVDREWPASGLDALLATDLDNDGDLDLVAFGAERGAVWLGAGDGTFTAAQNQVGLATAGAAGAAVTDFDIEGDLDVVTVGGKGVAVDLYRNNLVDQLERVGVKALPRLSLTAPSDVVASDLDRDGDLDLAVAHGRGVAWLDNLRQGSFADRTAKAGLGAGAALEALAAADLDNDGYPDLVGAGNGLLLWQNHQGSFTPWSLAGAPASGQLSDVIAFDGDNDGRLDLAAVGTSGAHVLMQQATPKLVPAALTSAPKTATAVLARDLDGDGDLDLVLSGAEGLHWLENRGGNKNHWLSIRLQGLIKGNSKNNFFGIGAVVEVKNGSAYQFREADSDLVHIGLGSQKTAEVVRVVWTNGVPQNRIALAGDQRLVEEQLLKGSCPFVYAWNGESFVFVTDLLWGAPIGMPVAPGKWASADPDELVRLDGLVAEQGRYELRVTEELWEAAYFDHLRLWVVDHPVDVEAASNLRVVPGEVLPDRVLGSRDPHPVVAAWDGRGRDVTERVRERDEVYAAGYEKSVYQGIAKEPWAFTFDLGTAPGREVRLLLDGWIFPADASLNLAVAQRHDLTLLLPRLEVETAEGWQELMPSMGFPAGKTKTMILDTPPLPAGAQRLRIVSSQWLHWDRIAWTTAAVDDELVVVAQLAPTSAELRYRGFSERVRQAPNAPHAYDYQRVSLESPWLPMPGFYTRYGEVGELLAKPDDLSVIMAPGDEIALTFDASALPPLRPGYKRTLFLESHGWDKDADRNTYAGDQVEPLPFRAMSGYPFAPGESYPDTPASRAYREEWLTREQ